MIDIHTHILYGVDDGAERIEESLELLEEAEKAGFSKIIFTSHYMEGYFTVGSKEREKVLKEIDSTKTSNVELFLGNEIFLTDSMISLLNEKKAVSLNNSRYVLFELPFNMKPISIMDAVSDMQSADLIPILAHPERYQYFYKTPEDYKELVENGVLLQVNFGSLDGMYGTRAKLIAEKLLEANLVHFLATDVHSPDSIYPEIPRIISNLNNLVGREKVRQLTEINPSMVLNNEEIDIERFSNIKLSFFEKRKLNKK